MLRKSNFLYNEINHYKAKNMSHFIICKLILLDVQGNVPEIIQ
jgi:hypothetical protein